jgi:hypothetical protein
MKKCPKCLVDVENNFELCWNCQYSFVDNKVLEDADFGMICPKCKTIIDLKLNYCPSCNYDLRKINRQDGMLPQGAKHIDCLRCKVQLDYQGNFKFHEGARMGVLGNWCELLTNRESFDLYMCPNCGKIEFFAPGFE